MEELKYLKSAYMNASEELKKQPAFLKKLKEIDGEVKALNDPTLFGAVNFDISSQNDKEVTISVFNSSIAGHIEDKKNRSCHIYRIALDDNNNLCTLYSTGNFYQKENERDTLSSFLYQYEKIQNGSELVLNRSRSDTLLDNYVPIYLGRMPLPTQNRSYEFASFDNEIQIQTRYHQPRIEYDHFKIEGKNYWRTWSAQRNPNDLKKAFVVSEVSSNSGVYTLGNKEVSINTSPGLDVMRIDPNPSIPSIVSMEQLDEYIKSLQSTHHR